MEATESPKVKLSFAGKCYLPLAELKRNVKKNRKAGYPTLEYADAAYLPHCAIVGGGPSLQYSLDVLRAFPGEIYAVSRTAAYLAKNGIPCTMFSVDPEPDPYPDHFLIKRVLLASRCSPNQFKHFKSKVVMFDNWEEDNAGGVQGGVTGITRAPYMVIKMGHRGAWFFGCDSCFSDLHQTHVTGNQKTAYQDLLIVRVGDMDYVSNASMLLQAEYLIEIMQGHQGVFGNASAGMLKAMLEGGDWGVVAVADSLQKKYHAQGVQGFNRPYKHRERWALVQGGA